MHCVTLIPGDGIGPEVTRSARDIVAATGIDLRWEVVEAGMRAGNEGGHPLPPAVFESIARNKIAVKGALIKYIKGCKKFFRLFVCLL